MNSSNYFTGLDDIPLHNWMKCMEGEINFVRKAENGTNEDDIKAWELIFDEYLAEFGLGPVQKKIYSAMKKKALLELDYVITGDRFKLTEIEIEVQKLEGILANAGNGIGVNQALVYMSKWLGSWINPKSITAREYFTLLGEYNKANK